MFYFSIEVNSDEENKALPEKLSNPQQNNGMMKQNIGVKAPSGTKFGFKKKPVVVDK